MTLRRFSENHAFSGEKRHKKVAVFFVALSALTLSVGCSRSVEPEAQNPDSGSAQVESDSVSEPPTASLDATSGQNADTPTSSDNRDTAIDSPSMAMDSTGDSSAASSLRPPANSELAGNTTNSSASANGSTSSGSDDGAPADVPKPADMSDDLPAYEMTNPIEEAAKKAFSVPEGMQRLGKDSNLWADALKKRLVVDGYVAINEGPLEMFACPVGTKEHESVVAVLAQAREVHAGLLAIGANSGTPVSFNPEYRPATGQRIAIWVLWRDSDGKIEKAKAQQWVKNLREDKPLESDWVFAGSSFWKDPESGREYYQADSGDLVCVSNFSTAMLDLPVESSQSNGQLAYVANAGNIPPQGTPVRLVFVPIPIPGAEPSDEQANPSEAPEDALVAAGNGN